MISMESLISGAGKSGWNWFDDLDPKLADMVKVRQAKADEDRRAIADAWAQFYLTPAGKKALDFLFDSTLRRTVFFAQLGLDPGSVAMWGSFREGQNALAHEIARQIAVGLGEAEDVKPRDR